MLPPYYFYWFRINNKDMTEPWLDQALMDLAYRSDRLISISTSGTFILRVNAWSFHFHARNRIKIKLICRLSKDRDQALISISRLKKDDNYSTVYCCYCKLHLFKINEPVFRRRSLLLQLSSILCSLPGL